MEEQHHTAPIAGTDVPMQLTVAASPHEKSRTHVPHLMRDVLIALLPACLFGIVWFGYQAALLCIVSVATCLATEYLYEKLLHRPITIRDGSAAVTGLLLAMNVPYTMPLPMLILADIFAIIIVKQLFGGLGKNIVNPALAARVFLFISFPSAMANYLSRADFTAAYVDAVSAATPLAALKAGAAGQLALKDLFLGTIGGSLGEVSTLLLLLGGIYLLCRRVITWHIPVSYLGTVALLTFLFPRGDGRLESMLLELCAGGLMLGAIFMATDYVTAPVTRGGRLLYGALCGAITVFIRYFGAYPEGVSFAILISNLLIHYLDRFIRPRPFGKRRQKK